MYGHLSKAVSQISDPALRRVVLFGIGGCRDRVYSTFKLGLVGSRSSYADNALENLFKGWGLWEWLLSFILVVVDFMIGLGVLLVLTILFPVVATLIVGFFLEDVVAAVETKHYPNEPAARPQPISEVIGSTGRFALVVIGLNLLCLPLYLIFLFVPPLNLVLYYILNGYLVVVSISNSWHYGAWSRPPHRICGKSTKAGCFSLGSSSLFS